LPNVPPALRTGNLCLCGSDSHRATAKSTRDHLIFGTGVSLHSSSLVYVRPSHSPVTQGTRLHPVAQEATTDQRTGAERDAEHLTHTCAISVSRSQRCCLCVSSGIVPSSKR